MPIELWSRKEGLRRPPAEPLYAEGDSKRFPATFRTRVIQWLIEGFGRIAWDGYGGEVINEPTYTIGRLYVDLCSAYGRESLDPHLSSAAPLLQLRRHVRKCPDNEVMDLIDAVFQVSARFTIGLATRASASRPGRSRRDCERRSTGSSPRRASATGELETASSGSTTR